MGSEGIRLIAGRNRTPDGNPIDSEAFHQGREFQIHDGPNTTVVFKPSDRPLTGKATPSDDPAERLSCALWDNRNFRRGNQSTEPALTPDSHLRATSRWCRSIRDNPDFGDRLSIGLR